MAKSFATEVAQRVVDDAVQIVGGAVCSSAIPSSGCIAPCGRCRIYEGATEIQRLIVAGSLLDEAGHA